MCVWIEWVLVVSLHHHHRWTPIARGGVFYTEKHHRQQQQQWHRIKLKSPFGFVRSIDEVLMDFFYLLYTYFYLNNKKFILSIASIKLSIFSQMNQISWFFFCDPSLFSSLSLRSNCVRSSSCMSTFQCVCVCALNYFYSCATKAKPLFPIIFFGNAFKNNCR